MKILIPLYYTRRFYCSLSVSATILVILAKISNRSGMAVQWNRGFSEHLSVDLGTKPIYCLSFLHSLHACKRKHQPNICVLKK